MITMVYCGAPNMAFHMELFRDLHWDLYMVLDWVLVNRVIIKL
jgi:hypothetical protein